ncbi:MAG TPA: alpha-L-rhamnosidase C-terminal domain-containing protein, partial [Saprospiraceae bacterium]|nr:alpha-L-rhamnosidase C-terminal domain-containing protein [Saprospiraceae bacterium]
KPGTDDGGVERPELSLMTGFIGTASISEALSANGKEELAYKLLLNEKYPSWLYSVVNGATTIWERLNSYTKEDGFGGNNSMNSFNHYSFGAVAAWMYNYSLGIQRHPEINGFKEFVLNPTPDPTKQLKFAKGYYDSLYGRIASEWEWKDGEKWVYKCTVPANTKASLYLPANKVMKESGKAIELEKVDGQNGWISLDSGSYIFEIGQ